MTEERLGERLFQVWSRSPLPIFDQQAGRDRFLARLAACATRSGRSTVVVAVAAAAACDRPAVVANDIDSELRDGDG
jgi:hypothetical protein